MSFLLTPRSQLSYGRYWEGRQQLQTMTARWADFCTQVLSTNWYPPPPYTNTIAAASAHERSCRQAANQEVCITSSRLLKFDNGRAVMSHRQECANAMFVMLPQPFDDARCNPGPQAQPPNHVCHACYSDMTGPDDGCWHSAF